MGLRAAVIRVIGLQQRRHVAMSKARTAAAAWVDEALGLRRQRRHRGIEVHRQASGVVDVRPLPRSRFDAASSRRLWNCTAATAESRASVALATAALASSIGGGGVLSSAV